MPKPKWLSREITLFPPLDDFTRDKINELLDYIKELEDKLMPNCPSLGNVIALDIDRERAIQDQKWGVQEHDNGKWSLILMEEVGEACEASLNNDPAALRHELVQVAAVAAAWIRCLDEKDKQ